LPDHAPLNLTEVAEASLFGKLAILRNNLHLLRAGKVLGPVAGSFYELMTAPTTKAMSVCYGIFLSGIFLY
jgi:hypothetical protein